MPNQKPKQKQPARKPAPTKRADQPTTAKRTPRGARLVVLGALAGAVLALTVSTALSAQGFSLLGGSNGGSEEVAFSAPAGTCLD